MTATERPCPDDLVMRAHRGELSQIERRALDAHLGQCVSCRAALAVAKLFDAIPDAQPGDDRLIARVAARAARGRRGLPTKRWMQVAAAATIALASGVATATWINLRWHRSEEARKAESPPETPRQHGGALPRRAVDIPVVQAPAPAGAGASPSPARNVAPARPETRLRGPLPVESEPQQRDAPSLFAEANAVRRSGELRRAIGLYRTLRRQFPESSQAVLASLSLGDLLLRLGDPVGALAAYDSYLEHQPAGTLTEEALFGRARALARLGRSAEERQTWEQLVHRYSRSAYRPAADRRLKELAR